MTRYEELTSMNLSDQEETGARLGEERMKRIIDQGLEKIERSKVARGLSERNIAVITAVKNLLDIALQKIPHVALPWAVISSSVDIFLKPVKSGIDLCNGVGYVVGRIEWFSDITDKILSQDFISDQESFRPIRNSIETSISALYQSLLFYQIQAVCFYNEKHHLFFLLTRGILHFDDWSGDLQGIKDAEERLNRDCGLYDLELPKSQVREIRICVNVIKQVGYTLQ
ncbi:WD40 repeat-like protein [Penicillium malachiteum]|uniref:WD40 repeat-like protein n=1 Tax=Penicillium malachiteum TaxID=1324776 RepID=UPI002546D067|nr:WD40 repeat-like protein [Penicillium malachiteum]KAJ5718829.1 WD40 repeat-like protein [Penicillium malachiteum]